MHDIGLQARHDAQGQVVFDVYVGGGLGRTPVIGSLIREELPVNHLLTYLESIMRVYNRYGRRDNKYKARIKILVRALTAEGFKARVEEDWAHIMDGPGSLTESEVAPLVAAFAPPQFEALSGAADELASQRLEHPAFSRWVKSQRNVPHKAIRLCRVVTLSTKVTGIPPGDVSDEQMDAVADWADALVSFGELRISHQQNFVLPHVAESGSSTNSGRAASAPCSLATANAGLLTDMICCPGGDYCSLANAKSIPCGRSHSAALSTITTTCTTLATWTSISPAA